MTVHDRPADPLLVLAATASELPRLRRRHGVSCALTGMRATRLPQEAIARSGSVLVAGTCGSLSASLPPGALLLATSVVSDGAVARPDAALLAALRRGAREARLALREGAIASSPSVVDGDEARLALAELTGAIAVDMESAAIARACEAAGRPWAVLRVVTDAPGQPLGWLAELLGGMPQDEPSAGRVLRGLVRRPRLLPDLVGLALLVRQGRRRIGRVVEGARSG